MLRGLPATLPRRAGMRPECAAAAAARRWTSVAAETAGPTAGTERSDVLPNERAEHDKFLAYCREEGKLLAHGVVPQKVCSTSRMMRTSEPARQAILVLASQNNPKVEPLPTEGVDTDLAEKYDFRGGRGLLMAEDGAAGHAVLRAPLERIGINAELLALRSKKGGDRYSSDPAAAVAFESLPPAETVTHIVNDLMIRDPYYHGQFHLALLLAWERCDPQSMAKPYLDTLPVPAIDNDVVLTVHSGGLDTLQSGEYMELHQDFLHVLKRLRATWLDRIERMPVEKTVKETAKARVPPIQVLDWSWRTVLGRQTPMPPRDIAPHQSCFRGSANRSVGYAQWFELTYQQHLLQPTLLPFLDLVDHGGNANCELDILMRPVFTSESDGSLQTVDEVSAEAYTNVLKADEKTVRRVVQITPQQPVRRGGVEQIAKTLNFLKRTADRAQEFIVGESGGTARDVEFSDRIAQTDAYRQEQHRLASEAQEKLAALESGSKTRLAPVIELRLLRNVEKGEPLTMTYARLHSRPFTLYRFGFEPL